jgi:type VI protein secretion system component VasF
MLLGIFVLFFLFGGMILAGFAIWALATKKDTLPQWAKVVLWLFVALAAVLLVAVIFGIIAFFGNVVMH